MAKGDPLGLASVVGPPVPKARPRTVRDPATGESRTFTPKRTKVYEEIIAGSYIGQKWYGGLVSLRVVVREGRGHPADLDNYIKIVSDALNGVAFEDDKQVVHIEAYIERDVANPRLDIAVYEWHQSVSEAILTPLPTEVME